ncbi:MAG: hypothetical protein R3292_03885 [Alcanivorax sp.]|nr:hypothetical protein [Alcanivorax sp.]
MKRWLVLVLPSLLVLLSGCATPITSVQSQELRAYQAKGLEIQEKNPTTAAALGILPGGGSFYTRNYGLGVVNLLLWPLSVLWDPMSGYNGAQAINYYATQQVIDHKQQKEMSRLDDSLMAGSITKLQYVAKKREIESKYSAD